MPGRKIVSSVAAWVALVAGAALLSASVVRADIAFPPVPPPPVNPGPNPPPSPSDPPAPTSPEPASIVTGLLGAGAASLAAWGFRRRRQAAARPDHAGSA